MTRSRPITFFLSAAVLPLSALAIAACGGGGAATASPAPTPSTSHPSTTSPRPAAVRVANSSLGKILVNSHGRTLYLFKADVGANSACTGACATAWPPLLATGNPTVGSGANASLVGTATRADGRRQVTYNGHPLYLFIKDTKPGQTNGQGVTAFGAAWFVISPSGNQISSHPAGHSSSSSPQPAAAAQPAPKPAAPPAANPAPQPAAPPAAKPKPPASNGIPQNGGGDGDSDNNGGPSDGDGNI